MILGGKCWAQKFDIKAAHFGATVLEKKPTGEGGTPKRIEIRLFEGVKVDEIDWGGESYPLPPAHHFPGGFTSWALRLGERLLDSEELQKESTLQHRRGQNNRPPF